MPFEVEHTPGELFKEILSRFSRIVWYESASDDILATDNFFLYSLTLQAHSCRTTQYLKLILNSTWFLYLCLYQQSHLLMLDHVYGLRISTEGPKGRNPFLLVIEFAFMIDRDMQFVGISVTIRADLSF